MSESCFICNRIEMIKAGTNNTFVAELETGYAVIGDNQFFRGYSLFLCKIDVHELHELEPEFRTKFLVEMAQVAEAACKAFKPVKMNYELLGNTDHHLHWHLFPRYADDPRPLGPIWSIDEAITYAESTKPTKEELEVLKGELLAELEKTAKIVRRFSDV